MVTAQHAEKLTISERGRDGECPLFLDTHDMATFLPSFDHAASADWGWISYMSILVEQITHASRRMGHAEGFSEQKVNMQGFTIFTVHLHTLNRTLCHHQLVFLSRYATCDNQYSVIQVDDKP